MNSSGPITGMVPASLERGATSSRDVVEAQTALQDAQNALVQAKVDYLIATITLRKRIGTLRVDERGMWR